MRRCLASSVLVLLIAPAAAQAPTPTVRHPKSSPAPSLVPTGVPAPNAAADAAKIAEVLAFEKEMEAAVVRGDVKFLERALSPDFIFTHGDGWTSGGAPLEVDAVLRSTSATRRPAPGRPRWCRMPSGRPTGAIA
jgi:hypothetical protein